MDQEPLLGRTIAGRYRVTRRLGSGGMGTVWEAVQEPLGRTVALKVLKTSYARDEVAIARFRKEASIVAGLSHPGIVTLHDYGETDDGLLYLVMEHLKGHTLGTVVKKTGRMPWERTVPIVQDIARALGAAHAVGVIHRDLKLENVMLLDSDDDKDHIKILDFGIAKSVHADEEAARLTQTDSSPGTPGYMSPELARGITDDPRSDLYALGVVWFELLVGQRPFPQKNVMDVFLAQMTQPAPALRERAPELSVPDAVDRLIQKLLEREPGKRPESTAALLDETFELLQGKNSRKPEPRAARTSTSQARDSSEASQGPSTAPSTAPTAAGLFLPTQFGAPPLTGVPGEVPADVTADAPTTMPATATSTSPHLPAPPTEVPATVLVPRKSRNRLSLRVAAQSVVFVVVGVGMAVFAWRSGPRGTTHGDIVLDGVLEEGASAPVIEVKKHAPRPRDVDEGKRPAPKPARPTASPAPSPAPASNGAVEVRPVSSAAPAASAGPAPVAPAAAAVAGSEPARVIVPVGDGTDERRRLRDLADRIRERLLLPDDVPGYRVLSARVTDDLAAKNTVDARAALDELEKSLADVRLTNDFIRAKMNRVEAALPAEAPADAKLAGELKRLRADVHERWAAGDLPGTNFALNKLWLAALKSKMRGGN